MNQQLAPAFNSGNIAISGTISGQNVAIGHGARVIQVIQQIAEHLPTYAADYTNRIDHFHQEYIGTAERPVPFGGRTQELTMLHTWFEDQAAPPYLLLTAPAGRGKSALLVHWSQHQLARPEVAVTFYPISVRFRTNQAAIVFPTLASRLAALHREKLTLTTDTPLEVWREFLAAYLARPLPDGRRHLLLLDGLDEAADWEATADLFPPIPPTRLRVLVSARYLAGDTNATPWLRRLGWEGPRRAHSIEIGPLSQAGVAEVVQSLALPLEQQDESEALTRELHRLSLGDPLVVRLYLEHLRERQASAEARFQPEDLRAIQPGLAGYFDRWWQDQRRLWGQHAPLREPAVQAVLTLLASALGPLLQEELLALSPPESGLSTWMLEETLLPLQRFVLGDGRRQGYTLSHPRLGMYFYEQLSERERRAAECRFLDWGQGTLGALRSGKLAGERVPHYLIQYYGAHLERSGAGADAFLALLCEEWQQAWEGLSGSYAGFLADTARAWSASEREDEAALQAGQAAPYLGGEVRAALCRASINSLAKHLPASLLLALVREAIWTPAQGLAYARQIPDSRQRAQVLVELACLGEGPLHTELAREAVEAVDGAGSLPRRAEFLARLLACFPGDLFQHSLSTVIEAARADTHLADRAQTLVELAAGLPEPKRQPLLLESLETARQIPHHARRARLLAALAPYFAGEARQAIFLGCLEAAQHIEEEASRAQILAQLAPHVPDQQQRAFLLATRDLGDQTNRARVLVAMAPALPEDMRRQVFAAVGGLRTREDRLSLLIDLVPALPADLLTGLLETGRTIVYSPDRTRLLSALARHLPQEHQLQAWREAWEAAREIKHEAHRTRVLASLASELPAPLKKGGLHEALEAVRAIGDAANRAQTLVALRPGLPGTALPELLESIRSPGSREERLHLLADLAPSLPLELKQRLLPEAVEEAHAIKGAEERWHVLARLAPSLPEQLTRALFRQAQAAKDEANRATLFAALAPVLPPDLKGELLHLARTMKHALHRAQVLVALAQALPEEHRHAGLQAALHATRAIKNEMSMMSLLARLVPALPDDLRQRHLQEAMSTALAIKSETYRAQVLCALAPVLPEGARRELLDEVRTMGYGPDRARVLVAVVPGLPAELRQTVLPEALEAVQTIPDELSQLELLTELACVLPGDRLRQLFGSIRAVKNEAKRGELLSALAPAAPDEWLPTILEDVQHMASEAKRTQALAALAPHLTRLPETELYGFWRSVLREGARRTRRSLLADLTALAPLLPVLGGPAAVTETFRAIGDVGRWWP
jgi:hypothetical protein